MRLKVGIGFITLSAALALAGCGHGTVIGSAPLPTPTPVAPSVTKEISLPGTGGAPGGTALGNDGLVYVTEPGNGTISAYNTQTQTFNTYIAKAANAQPSGITVGPDGNIWFTEPGAGQVGNISPPHLNEFVVGAGTAPALIASGPNSSLYFTEPGANAIGTINTGTDTVGGPFAIPTANANPLGIATGTDNNVYFTEYNAAKIGRFNTVTHTVDEEIPLPAGSANPAVMVLGPDTALWFTENNPAAPKLGRLSVTTGKITEFPLTGAGSASALVVGLDNNMYFLDAKNNAVGVFIVNAQTTSEFKIPTNSALTNGFPIGIAIGTFQLVSPATIYFTEASTDKLGQFTYF